MTHGYLPVKSGEKEYQLSRDNISHKLPFQRASKKQKKIHSRKQKTILNLGPFKNINKVTGFILARERCLFRFSIINVTPKIPVLTRRTLKTV